MAWPFYVALGYLLGSFPTGVLLGRLVGRDPRRGGSGNIGASNVTRTLGKKWGALTLLFDLAKGAAATWIALAFTGDLTVATGAAFAAVAGHCYPVWLKLRGGKGVATAFGTMLVFSPIIAGLGALAWIALVYISRIPTVGSLAAAVLFAVVTRLGGQPFEVHVYTLALAALILLRHTGNLRAMAERRRQRKLYRSRV